MYVVCFPSVVPREWDPLYKGDRHSPRPIRDNATSLHDATKSGYSLTITTRVQRLLTFIQHRSKEPEQFHYHIC
jgi:hypothetical protein